MKPLLCFVGLCLLINNSTGKSVCGQSEIGSLAKDIGNELGFSSIIYASNINAICNYYLYYLFASVFFIFFFLNNFLHSLTPIAMQWLTNANVLTRQLSKNAVSSTIVPTFNHLKNILNSNGGRIKRPMVVASIRTLKSLNTLKKITKQIKMSYPLWVVAFPVSTDGLCNICNAPVENYFSTTLDTNLYVWCCCTGKIYEWWSIDGEKIEYADFGHWSINEGLELFNYNSLNRRKSLNGKELRVIHYNVNILLNFYNLTILLFIVKCILLIFNRNHQ